MTQPIALPGRRRPATTAILALVALLLAACSGSTGGPAATASGAPATAPATPTAAASAAPGSTPGATGAPSATAPGVELTQAWATATLTDVRDGSTFRVADLVAANRVVFIETMAIWCSNCRAQQKDVVKALAGLDPARVTWIGIDVDGSETASDLAAYSDSLGFDWPYAVGSADFLRALSDEFGTQVLSPPSTPILVVGTDGTVTLTEFGHKSVDRIRELAASHGA